MSDFERLKQATQAGMPLKIEDLPASQSVSVPVEQADPELEPRKQVPLRKYLPLLIILGVFYGSLLIMIIVVLVAISIH